MRYFPNVTTMALGDGFHFRVIDRNGDELRSTASYGSAREALEAGQEWRETAYATRQELVLA